MEYRKKSVIVNAWDWMGAVSYTHLPRKLSTISITALDRMARFNRSYDTTTAYPASLYQVLSDACLKCGVPLATTSGSLINATYSPPKRPESDGLTYRQVVEWIAELAGTCAWIDWDGKLRLTWYADTTTRISPSDRFTSDMQENDITITGMQIVANDETCLLYTSVHQQEIGDWIKSETAMYKILERVPPVLTAAQA